MRGLTFILMLLAAYVVPAAAQAPAQSDWPPPLVKIVVPFAPGSTPDIMARILADKLQQTFPKSNFIIDNKPGASGNIGTDAVAKAPPDGATIGISIGGPLAINTLLFKDLRYNPAKDIAAITQLVTQPSVLVVSAGLNVNTVADLIVTLKKDPGKYNYGSIGNGSLSHLAMEAIALKADAKLVHLPLRGSPAVVAELLRGDVQIACLPASAVVPHLQSGKLKMLAVSTAARSKFFPEIPTLKESGVDVEADAWMGLIAPAGLSPALIGRIHASVAEAMASKDIVEKLANQQIEAIANSPAEFRAVIDAEIGRWEPVIKAANIKIE